MKSLGFSTEFRCLEHRPTFDFEMDSLFKPLQDMFKHHDFRVKYKKTGDNILGFCTSLFLSILYSFHLYTFLLYRAENLFTSVCLRSIFHISVRILNLLNSLLITD